MACKSASHAQSTHDLDLSSLSWQLQQAGWDAISSERGGQVAARRDLVPGRQVWTLVIDRRGSWRFTVTRSLELAGGAVVERGGHVHHLLREQQMVITATGRLADQADLPGLLIELAQLALEETGASAHPAEGNTLWDESRAPGTTINPH